MASVVPPSSLAMTTALRGAGGDQHTLKESFLAVVNDRDRRVDRREQYNKHDHPGEEVLQVSHAFESARGS